MSRLRSTPCSLSQASSSRRRWPARLALYCLVLLAALSWSSSVLATSSKLPQKHVARDLVVPKKTFRFDAGTRWPFYDGQFKHVFLRDPVPDLQFLNPGFTFGITKDAELGFVVPVMLNPDLDPEDPRVHALYQFKSGRVDLGVFGALRLGVFDVWQLTGGVPVFFHWNDNLRLDTGGFMVLTFGPNESVSLVAPASFVFQLGSSFYLGPETGVVLSNLLDDNFNASIVAGGFLGFTLAGSGGTLGDIYGRFRMPDIEVGPDVMELMIGLEFYFDM